MTSQFVCEAVQAAPKRRYVYKPPRLVVRECSSCERQFSYMKGAGGHKRLCGASDCPSPKLKEYCCKNCGKEIRSKHLLTYCGACKHVRMEKAHQTRSANARKRNERICQYKPCGSVFWIRSLSGAARRGLTNEGQFCSRKCLGEAISERAALRKAAELSARLEAKKHLAPNICECGQNTKGRQSQCEACAKLKDRASRLAKYNEAQRTIRETPRNCRNPKCNSVFVPASLREGQTRRRKFCSAKCCDDYHKDAAGHTHRKRARYHGVAYEYINALKVLERDNYRCQMCGAATPKRLRGSIDDRAPELDHRVPMAMGGPHIWSNVQCACRRCNIMKSGSRAAGQTNFFDLIEDRRRHQLRDVNGTGMPV